jgi:hypothetical protein
VTAYVDDVRHQFGRMVMCHMWADTLPELLAMVDKIGVQRKWLQQPPKASWIHFDISLSKKAEAIRHGAILTDKYGPSEHTARLVIASGNAEVGERMLASIARCRDLRKAE